MLSENINEFIKYYQNLLIIQYHNKPKAKKVIAAFIRPLAEVYDLAKELENAFNINTARGQQLDIVAKYFGVKRRYNNIVFDKLWHNYQYIDGYVDGLSFQTLKNPIFGGTWTLETKNKSYYDLNDQELRMLIKLRIIGLNNEILTYKTFYDKFFELFGSEIDVVASGTMNVAFYFDDSTNIGKVLKGFPEFFPVPAGVGSSSSDLPERDPFFTLSLLSINGGVDYNYYQAGVSLVGNTSGGKIRLVG